MAAPSCSLNAVRADCHQTLCTKDGWTATAKNVGVALATIAALGLALALTMRFSSTVANSTVGQFLSQAAGGKLMTYVLAGSASLLGVLAAGRVARACNII